MEGVLSVTLNSGDRHIAGFSSLPAMCPGTLASSALQTLLEAEGWSVRTKGVSGCYLSGILGADSKDMAEEFPQRIANG